MKILLLTTAAVMFASGTRAGIPFVVSHEDSAAEPQLATITIQSVPDSAHVVLDGHEIGTTPITRDSLMPGPHTLVVLHPDVASWLAEPTSDTLLLSPGEVRTFRYTLRSRYLITSSPFGAEVLLGDSSLGTTPLATSLDLDQRSIMLRKQGYEPSTIRISGNNIVSIPLRKLWSKEGVDESYLKELDGGDNKPIGLYIAGAATVVSGVAAAYFKVKADGKYQQYLDTGNNTLLSQTNDLDTAAGIAIAATQVGLGLFTYFLFSQ